jgi:predicted amidophosphoribosyltransferase
MKPGLEGLEEGCCPGCGEEVASEETNRVVCSRCAARLHRELAAYLEFIAACRETA